MFALIAVVLFLLAAFGVEFESVGIVPLGLAFMAFSLLVGNWPIGYFSFNRPPQG